MFKKIAKEFKQFAIRGNVVDMAIGIILGAAFGEIVNSLVKDVLMPPLGVIIGGIDFSDLKLPILGTNVFIGYGKFINTIIHFTIVSFAVFIIIKVMNTLRRDDIKAEQKANEANPQEVLLAEIRDILKNGQGK